MKITKDLKYLLIEYTIDHPKEYMKFIDLKKIEHDNWITVNNNYHLNRS